MKARPLKMRNILHPLVMTFLLLACWNLASSPRAVSAAVQTTFYVSPSGSDSNPGTQSEPFQTLAKAQSAVRAINGDMTGDIVVKLMDGTYNLTSTLTFTSEDSGTNGYSVIYQADAGTAPVVSGGTSIAGWTLWDSSKNMYRAHVDTALNTRQFYVDGVRATRARGADNPGIVKKSDNSGYTLPTAGVYANMASWRNVQDIEFVSKKEWQGFRIGVESVSGSNVTMKEPGWGYITGHGSGAGDVSWVENAYELLDSPGEWYLDRSEGYLYYIPRASENMTTSSFVAATLETLVNGAGTLDNPMHNIVFDGIAFAYNTWLLPSGNIGYPDNQSGVLATGTTDLAGGTKLKTPAGVTFSAAKNITIKNSTFTHMGNAALNFDHGSQNNTIDYNTIIDVSGNGINIGGIMWEDHTPSDPRSIVKNNVVSNNTITNIGVEYFDNVAIFAGYTQGTVITHNTMYNLPYSGVSVGWGWGYVESSGPTVSQRNIISHNLIYDFMKVLKDGGGIYTLGSQAGSRVYNNYIYGMKNGYAFLYRDNGSAGFFDSNNVISSIGSTLDSYNSPWWYYTNTNNGGHWNAHDNYALYNYYSSERITHGTGGTNVVSNNYAVPNYAWGSTAQAIIANAGVGGGNGPAPNFAIPIPGKVEAEFALLGGTAEIALNHTGYTGVGYVDGYCNSDNASTTFEVVAPSAGTYRVKLYYSAGAGMSNNTGLYVNGVKMKNLTLAGTSDWDTWASATELVALSAGVNTIAFKAEMSSTACIALDKIDVSSTNINYTPPSKSNLKLWLMADAGVTSDVNGKVSSWADQSGNANHAVQTASGNQPTLVASAINGMPAIKFDGIDDNLLSSGVTGPMNAFTVMFVIKPQAVANYNQNIGAAGAWGQYAFHTTSSGEVYAGTSTSSRITPSDGPGPNTLVAGTVSRFAYVFNNGAAKLYKDGTLLASKTLSNPAAWTGFLLGANNPNTINGDLGEVLVYNTALSETDRQNVDTYLQNKYTPFTPPASSTLMLWLKTDSGITSDGTGKVTTWADQSGNANHATPPASGYAPTVVSNAVNGWPVIRFDGVDDSLLSSGVTGSMDSFTVMFVLKPHALANYNQNIGAAGGWGQYLFHSTSTGGAYTGTSASSRIEPSDGPGANTLVTNAWHRFTYVFNNGSAKLYKNGTLLASKTLSNPSPWAGFTLGNNSTNTINGDIAEVFVYNSALSDTDRQSIEAYLQKKYGL